MSLVEAKNLRKQFADQVVFEGLDLTINEREFVVLCGPSGCGKSTVLRLIAGLEKASGGSLQLNPKIENHRAMVFQEDHLLTWRNALENVLLPFELKSAPQEVAQTLARQWLVDLGLGDSLGKFPHELSGGMKMRVSIARSLAQNPRLLLMDEPFAALDESARFRLQEKLRLLFESAKEMSVVFVTHAVSEAVFLADRIVFFNSHGLIKKEEKIEFSGNRDLNLRLSEPYYQTLKRLQNALA